jgi:flagella basal body P-ring formation protein FlgA
LELRSDVQVDSGGVYLNQILSGPISALSSHPIRLAQAPALGQTTSLSRSQINAALAKLTPGLSITHWSGADAVRISRRARLLQEDELRQLLNSTLQRDQVKDRGELELRMSRRWAPVLVPDEPLLLNVLDLPATGVSANFIVRFEVRTGPERFGPWQTVVQARVMKDVIVARSPLRRGQSLHEGEFTFERRDVLPLHEPLDEAALRNPSLEILESLSAGQILLARSVRLRPVMVRGQMVDGLVRDGALQINIRVEVLVDGLPGQLVRVRNPKTKREFYAKVRDEQTVIINL